MQKDLNTNINSIKTALGESNELITKEITCGKTKCAILYILGLTDTISLSKFVIDPLLAWKDNITPTIASNQILTLGETQLECEEDKIINLLLKGKGVLLIDNTDSALILAVDKFQERAISEPPTSAVLKGPRAGFTENLKTNLAILRKILATPNLRTTSTEVGKHTKTTVTIVYIDKVADNNVVDNVKKRISSIDIDGIIDSYYIASYLEERPNSMFKQIGNSEKPDVVAGKLLEGRVAIIVDGSPLILTVPFVYIEELQSGDDYYSSPSRASFVRVIRIISILITILTPAMYIAIVLHHHKAIPLKFLITIVNTTKGLPLTPFAEILFVLLLFEILYEASLRMPKYLGLALSIVGALILGDTAVKAGLISPPAVMIIAISGLSIYCIPDQAPQLYTLRVLFTLSGAFLGFFGITAMVVFFLVYLSDFDTYGTPYLAPIAPFIRKDMKDSLYKIDITRAKTRPSSISNNKNNLTRQGRQKNGKNNFK